MTDARKLLEDYHSYSSGADSAEGARLHMTTAALLAVLDLHQQRSSMGDPWCDLDNEDWPCPTVRAIDRALGVTDD